MSELGENLKTVISEADAMLSDSLTFSLLRVNGGVPDANMNMVGGGNYLMALGAFSVLGFHSHIHHILTKGLRIIDQKDQAEVEAYIKKIKTDLKSKKLSSGEKLDRYVSLTFKGHDYINGEDAFVNYIAWLRDSQDLDIGLSNEDARLVWRVFRNPLSHIALPHPKGLVGTFTVTPTLGAVKDLELPISDTTALVSKIKEAYKASDIFSASTDNVSVQSDVLVAYTLEAKESLFNLIDTAEDPRLKEIVEWLELFINRQVPFTP